MGNYNTRPVTFKQSVADFPLTVALGEKSPVWGLSRWDGNGSLRFVPPDDDGFTLRGDKQRLVYKGQRRSHRFTILGDGAFEYDCILEREPESNVISLMMEGAENYDFFRQPDFVPDPFLKGSYAVYKKETLLGEGTGKLCHIHRPEIIDARGRRCWGELAVIGNRLYITIPEMWLVEAKYPVVVDPTIGTTTVGSQYLWDNDPPEPWIQLMFEGSIPVNRFLVSETINGLCTAYMYSHVDNYDENGGRPVLYSDNGNSPLTRRSMNEQFADFAVNGSKPAGWRSSSFNSNGSIASGSYIWFGVFTDFFWEPRFDYGAKCYSGDWWDKGTSIPNTYPHYNVNWFSDFKLSMYFTYSSAQNYERTLTQGVRLSDNRKIEGDYKRSAIQTVRINSALSRFETIIRKCVMTVINTMNISRLPGFFRTVTENIKATLANYESRSILRICTNDVQAYAETKKTHGIIRNIHEILKGIDNQTFSIFFIRTVPDNVSATHAFKYGWEFFRGLLENAGSIAETTHGAAYYRHQTDTVKAVGAVFRGLLIFVRILTTAFLRDYILRRFLVAREELVLKSGITRDLILESKIN